MKFLIFSLLLFYFHHAASHDRVIIGVVTIEISKAFELIYEEENYTSYVPASYIKWIEQGGARAVPIFLGQNETYYRDMLSKVNGVVFPGGSIDKNKIGGYAEVSGLILNIATEMNENGDFFPIFGIGSGMDMLLYHTNNDTDVMGNCSIDLLTVSIKFTKRGSTQCAMYNATNPHIRTLLSFQPTAVFNSKRCVSKEVFDSSDLAEKWHIFSLNIDQENKMFVSGVEHKVHPFYGVLFHPEKISFEWAEKTNIPHTLNAVEASQYFSNYFVNECRKNQHWFDSKEEEDDYLFANYPIEFTSKKGSPFMQSYLFKESLQ